MRRRTAMRSLAAFARADRGAVTVEWVVLTAAVTGIFVAALDAEKAALRSFWSVIGGGMEAREAGVIGDPNGGTVDDFEDGVARGWSGASVTGIPGFGKALGPIHGSGGRESVTHDVILAKGTTRAVIAFDLYGIDSLDGEDAVLYVNGVEVGRVRTLYGSMRLLSANDRGIGLTVTQVGKPSQIGGYFEGDPRWGMDGISQVSITVDDPGDVLSFGIGSTANGGVKDESYAIDRFNVTATGTAPTS